ncbi:hypothetical protein E2320_001970, partial [Naja naja]
MNGQLAGGSNPAAIHYAGTSHEQPADLKMPIVSVVEREAIQPWYVGPLCQLLIHSQGNLLRREPRGRSQERG